MSANAFILRAKLRAILINSNILESLNSFQPPLTVGTMTTSPSKNMDMISRVAEKGIGVNSSGIYGATNNVARLVTH